MYHDKDQRVPGIQALEEVWLDLLKFRVSDGENIGLSNSE